MGGRDNELSYTTDVLEEHIKELEQKLGEFNQHNLELMNDLSEAQNRIKVWKHSSEEAHKKLGAIRKIAERIKKNSHNSESQKHAYWLLEVLGE